MSLAKRRIAAVFFLFTGFSLFAQTYREAKIYIPPIIGTGTMEDNAFFFKQLAYEVILQYHSLVRSRNGSDFILMGTIAPYTGEDDFPADLPEESEFSGRGPVPARPIPDIRNIDGNHEFFSWEVEGNLLFFDASGGDNYNPEKVEEPAPERNESVFTLELIESSSGKIVARQYLIYKMPDPSVGELVSVLVYYMLSGIPDIEETDNWRSNFLFVNLSGIWSPEFYLDQKQPANWINFGASLFAEFRFTDLLSAGLGVQFVKEVENEYDDFILEIPLAVKLVFEPINNFQIEPYAGGSLNLSLTGTTQPFHLSVFLGIQFGIRAGPGMVTIDPRLSIVPEESSIENWRYRFQISVGYKFGFFPKRAVLRDY